MDTLIALLKQHGGVIQVVELFEGTPLGRKLAAHGYGQIPSGIRRHSSRPRRAMVAGAAASPPRGAQ